MRNYPHFCTRCSPKGGGQIRHCFFRPKNWQVKKNLTNGCRGCWCSYTSCILHFRSYFPISLSERCATLVKFTMKNVGGNDEEVGMEKKIPRKSPNINQGNCDVYMWHSRPASDFPRIFGDNGEDAKRTVRGTTPDVAERKLLRVKYDAKELARKSTNCREMSVAKRVLFSWVKKFKLKTFNSHPRYKTKDSSTREEARGLVHTVKTAFFYVEYTNRFWKHPSKLIGSHLGATLHIYNDFKLPVTLT